MRALFHAEPPPPRVPYAWVLFACLLVAWAYVRTAAVTEDAFITFRVIDNALSGYGLVWNVGERVQPYTHPLWALLLLAASAVSGEIFNTALALSLALTLACTGLIVRHARGPWTALWAVLALLLSEAFVEYSSASLENALAHALVVAMVVSLQAVSRADARRAWLPALCAGLLAITRHDLAILAGPTVIALLVVTAGRSRWRSFGQCVALSTLPLLLWSVFSVGYYGSPWPNSAYAKLNNGLSLWESFVAAEPYFRDLSKYDAVTAVTLVVAFLRGAFSARWQLRMPAFGLALYVAYLGAAGGDYMGGRLFSPPFALAVAIIALSVRLQLRWSALICIAATLALGLHRGWLVWDVHPHAQIRKMSQHAWMYPYSGWRSTQRLPDFRNMPWGEQGLRARSQKHEIVAKCAVGLYGFNAGAGVRIIDPLAITDGFLARLPSKRPAYPGHFERAFPAGYLESITSGQNRLTDPALRRLYELTQLLSRAPLFDAARLQAIWAMNTGEDRRLARDARYDPNATYAPGLATTSTDTLACMGQLDPLLTVRLR